MNNQVRILGYKLQLGNKYDMVVFSPTPIDKEEYEEKKEKEFFTELENSRKTSYNDHKEKGNNQKPKH